MNTAEPGSNKLSMAEKLGLAREAYRKYYIQCFWFMRENIEIGPDDLGIIAKGLRSHGDRQAFIIAGRLCR
jgi:hypothetical protein